MVTDIPKFFVPAATEDNVESVYADFAKWCNCSIPETGKRIYSIMFTGDGEEWTATVGESLKGTKTKRYKRKGQWLEQSTPLSDPAMVLAIFAGRPYFVVTNKRIDGVTHSAFENPFMAGEPRSITYFPTEKEQAL